MVPCQGWADFFICFSACFSFSRLLNTSAMSTVIVSWRLHANVSTAMMWVSVSSVGNSRPILSHASSSTRNLTS